MSTSTILSKPTDNEVAVFCDGQPSKRVLQNRKAQAAFRERRRKKLIQLEDMEAEHRGCMAREQRYLQEIECLRQEKFILHSTLQQAGITPPTSPAGVASAHHELLHPVPSYQRSFPASSIRSTYSSVIGHAPSSAHCGDVVAMQSIPAPTRRGDFNDRFSLSPLSTSSASIGYTTDGTSPGGFSAQLPIEAMPTLPVSDGLQHISSVSSSGGSSPAFANSQFISSLSFPPTSSSQYAVEAFSEASISPPGSVVSAVPSHHSMLHQGERQVSQPSAAGTQRVFIRPYPVAVGRKEHQTI